MSNQFLDFKIINVADTNRILAACTGNPDKGIFLCYKAADKSMQPFLAKILSAVKLDLQADTLTLEKTADNDFSFSTLAKDQTIYKALFFGINPKTVGLHLNFQKYQPFTVNGCLYLFADDLKSISENQDLKRLLWGALQSIFTQK